MIDFSLWPLKKRSDIVQMLENSRQELNAAAGDILESHAHPSPEAARWSVLECVEHITTAEQRFLGLLERAQALDAPPIDKEKEAMLMARVTSRVKRVEAPEAARPTGRFTGLAQALEHFNATRARVIQFAEERGDDLYLLAIEHPRFGKLNGTELLLIIAGHARRHAEQIRETKAAFGKS